MSRPRSSSASASAPASAPCQSPGTASSSSPPLPFGSAPPDQDDPHTPTSFGSSSSSADDRPDSRSKSRFSFLTLLIAHPAHVVTYLVCVALFSISFLVFVNSTVSFVITERLGGVRPPVFPPDAGHDPHSPGHRPGDDDGMGNAVGTLGFADELVTLVACPVWGLLSDRVGVRPVVVSGYGLVSAGLVLLVMARNVFPQLLLARLVFSLGAAAMTTMITAMLPTITYHASMSPPPECPISISPEGAANCPQTHERQSLHNNSASSYPSELEGDLADGSDVTITPARFRMEGNLTRSQSCRAQIPDGGENTVGHDEAVQEVITINAESAALSFRIAGVLGTFAGFGALLALFVFLPLPAFFQSVGQTPSEAVESSYHVVAVIAVTLAFVCFFGLRNLPGEEGKRLGNLVLSSLSAKDEDEDIEEDVEEEQPLLADPTDADDARASCAIDDTTSVYSFLDRGIPTVKPYYQLLSESLLLGFKDADIGLGYLSSFVARASSVAISLFIPLLINVHFRSSDRCGSGPDPPGSGGGPGNGPGDVVENLSDIRKSCPRAYTVAAALTGTSQLVALLSAPFFGYLSSRETLYLASRSSRSGRFSTPLLVASVAGVLGFSALASVTNPDPFGTKGPTEGSEGDGGEGVKGVYGVLREAAGGNPIVLLFVSLMGLAQIGSTVCGLGLLARGIQRHAQQACERSTAVAAATMAGFGDGTAGGAGSNTDSPHPSSGRFSSSRPNNHLSRHHKRPSHALQHQAQLACPFRQSLASESYGAIYRPGNDGLDAHGCPYVGRRRDDGKTVGGAAKSHDGYHGWMRGNPHSGQLMSSSMILPPQDQARSAYSNFGDHFGHSRRYPARSSSSHFPSSSSSPSSSPSSPSPSRFRSHSQARGSPPLLAVSAHKGTIGSISSLSGACGILVITKLGGLAFDKVNRGFPFVAVAGFFALLFVVILSVGLVRPRRV